MLKPTVSELVARGVQREELFSKAAEILRKSMSREEFLEFQLAIDNDHNHGWWLAVSKEAKRLAPAEFGDIIE